MHDAMVTTSTPPRLSAPRWPCSEAGGDCGSWVALPFFVSFVLLTTFVVLKMIIALILVCRSA